MYPNFPKGIHGLIFTHLWFFHTFSCYWLLISFHCAWRIYFCLPHFRFITSWLPNAFYSKPFLFHLSDFIWEVLILLQALKMLLVMHVVWLKMYWVPFKIFPDIASSKICIFLLWLLWFFLCLNSRTTLKSPAMMLFSKPLTKNPLWESLQTKDYERNRSLRPPVIESKRPRICHPSGQKCEVVWGGRELWSLLAI